MGDDRLKGGDARDGKGEDERGIEPAAVLVVALEIEVAGIFRAALAQNAIPGRARIEPDVHDVGLLAVIPIRGGGVAIAFREQILRLGLEPNGGAVLAEKLRDMGEDGLFEDWGAILVIKNRQRNAPDALARDAPVRAVLDHVDHLLLAPGGNPLDVLDRVEEVLADRLDGAEPLRGRAEDDGLLGAPVMGIAMDDVDALQDDAFLGEAVDDAVVDFLIEHAIEFIAFKGAVDALFIDESLRMDAIFRGDVKVVEAVVGVGMDATGARLVADESRVHDEGFLILINRLDAGDAFEFIAMERLEQFTLGKAPLLDEFLF